MPNIDDLSVGIKSNVTSATNSIDKLIKRLGVLSSSLGQVNTNGFYHMAQGINQIESATKQLTSDSASKLTNLSLAIRKFGSATATAATSNIPQLSSAITNLSNTMTSIGAVNFNADGITQFAKAINRLGGVKVGDAITNLPYLSVVIKDLSNDISGLSANADSVSNLTQLASALSRLGGKAVTTSISNIPQLTKALMQMFTSLSKAPQVSQNVIRLTEAMANLASQGSKVGIATRSMSGGLTNFSSHAKSAHKSAHSLASAIGKLYAKYWMLFRILSKFGGSIKFASDLKEVQNVIDVSFGNYKNVIEEFSKTSIQDYGISELTAKTMAGRFQAMGTAVGFSQEKMADMSVELTKLAADMASFYNVEASEVAESLQSVFTGTTKPMRAYGVDLTMATLQEYALSKGIDANVKSMSQAEKVMLRYNYVIEHTRNAQGDFQRTQDTWANQIKMLKQQFQALGGVIGQNFIYALKPMVQGLNVVMGKLIQFAKVVSESLGTIFGWKYEESTGGMVNDLENGSEFADDLGAGLGTAADNAKKLNQQLQKFDELNVLSTQKDTGTGGSGGGSVGGSYDVPAISTGKWTKTDDEDNFFTSNLDSLYKLGDYISTTIKEQLQSIDWEEVYQGAKDWGKGLASFLNGYINPEMFYETGEALAGALNTAIYAALSFAETFDFANFGDSWAQRFNGFFEELDTASLAEAISKWIRGALTSVTTFLTNTDFELIGQKVGDFVTNIDWGGIVIDLGKLAKAILGAIVDAFIGLSSDPNAMLEIGVALAAWFGTQAVIGKIATALSGAIASATSSATLTAGVTAAGASIGTTLAAALVAAFIGYGVGSKIDDYLHEHGIALDDIITGDDPAESQKVWTKMEEYARDFSKSYQDLVNSGYYTDATLAKEGGEQAFNATRNKLIAINNLMEKSAKTMSYAEFKNTSTYEGALEQLFGGDEAKLEKKYKNLQNALDNFANLPTTAAMAYSKAGVNFAKTSNTVSKSQKICTTAMLEMGKAGVKFDETTGKVFNNINNTYNESSEVISDSANKSKSSIEDVSQSIQNSIGAASFVVKNKTKEMATANDTNLTAMQNKGSAFNQSYVNGMSNTFLGVVDIAKSQMANMKTVVGNGFSAVANSINSDKNKTKWYDSAWYLANESKNGIIDRISKSEDYGGSLNTRIGNAFNVVANSINSDSNKKKWSSAGTSLATETTTSANKEISNTNRIEDGLYALYSRIKDYGWNHAGEDLVNGLSDGITRKWGLGVGSAGSLVATVGSLAYNLTTALKNAFGIHSPSRIWKNEIGVFLPMGLQDGIESGEHSVLSTVNNFGNAVNQAMSGALTLATPNNLSTSFDFGISSSYEHLYSSDNSVSSNIADGITRGMYSAQSEQNDLLRQQNELLYQILQKDAISTDDLYNIVVSKNIDTFNRTGDNLLLI